MRSIQPLNLLDDTNNSVFAISDCAFSTLECHRKFRVIDSANGDQHKSKCRSIEHGFKTDWGGVRAIGQVDYNALPQ
jgi:hypothetical protein